MTSTPPPIRHEVFTRTPMSLTPYTQALHKPFPRWLRRLLLLLLALLLVLFGAVACRENQKPASLANSTLVGPRLTTGPVCIEEAVDISGSMTQYTSEREQAEAALFAFARRALRPTDLMSEGYFAATSDVVFGPTPMQSLSAPPSPPNLDPNQTILTPVIDKLVAARPVGPSRCSARALVMITDGYIEDQPATIEAALARGNYTRMYAVVPTGVTGANRGALNGGLLDSITVYGFHGVGSVTGRAASIIGNAKPLDVIFGDILGDLTGQRLDKIKKG